MSKNKEFLMVMNPLRKDKGKGTAVSVSTSGITTRSTANSKKAIDASTLCKVVLYKHDKKPTNKPNAKRKSDESESKNSKSKLEPVEKTTVEAEDKVGDDVAAEISLPETTAGSSRDSQESRLTDTAESVTDGDKTSDSTTSSTEERESVNSKPSEKGEESAKVDEVLNKFDDGDGDVLHALDDDLLKKLDDDILSTLDNNNDPKRIHDGGSGGGGQTKCNCKCEMRLQELEGEIDDLKRWKWKKQEFDDVISSWKAEVDRWMLTKFGFKVTLSTPGPGQKKSERVVQRPHQTEAVPLPSSSRSNVRQCFNEGSSISSSQSRDQATEDPSSSYTETDGVENVEITPDIFGHFLLDNDDEEERMEEGMEEDDDDDDEDDDEDDEEEDQRQTRRNVQIIKMRADDEIQDSESDCFTISSKDQDSSDSDMSSDEEYSPAGAGYRGKGRNSGKVSTNNDRRPGPSTSASKSTSNQGKNTMIANSESRNELMKHCRRKQGNLWECQVCGFMLSSLENMLLHVKYNHATAAHTCPYCKVVVLCRSPKDAVMHQNTCKMRNNGSNPIRTVAASVPVPVPVHLRRVQVPVPIKRSKLNDADVHAKVDKMVDALLQPRSILRRTTNNSSAPAVVTLSSDEGED